MTQWGYSIHQYKTSPHMRIKELTCAPLCVMVHDTIFSCSLSHAHTMSRRVWVMGVVGVRIKCAHVMATVGVKA